MRHVLFIIISVIFIAQLAGCGSKKEAEKKEIVPKETKDSLVIEYPGQDNMTVLALLQKSHEVVTVPSAMGTFVKAIDSVENGSHVFWFYSVNDEIADIAADKYMTSTGDTVKWLFRFIGTENEEPELPDSLAEGIEKVDK